MRCPLSDYCSEISDQKTIKYNGVSVTITPNSVKVEPTNGEGGIERLVLSKDGRVTYSKNNVKLPKLTHNNSKQNIMYTERGPKIRSDYLLQAMNNALEILKINKNS